jgi:alkylation response protein AidB-like acyl-CoA dehydrogenase
LASKLASEVAVRVTEQAIQVPGEHSYVYDHPLERWFRDAKVFSIYEGTARRVCPPPAARRAPGYHGGTEGD